MLRSTSRSLAISSASILAQSVRPARVRATSQILRSSGLRTLTTRARRTSWSTMRVMVLKERRISAASSPMVRAPLSLSPRSAYAWDTESP